MGMTDLQLVSAEGDSDGAANQDYQTRSISAQDQSKQTLRYYIRIHKTRF